MEQTPNTILRAFEKALNTTTTTNSICFVTYTGENLTFVFGPGLAEASSIALPIGADNIVARFFKHKPPTPDDIEYAINTIEDNLMTLVSRLPKHLPLYSNDEALRSIAMLNNLAVEQQPAVLSREAMEATFSRLAAVVAGRPAAMEQFPDDEQFNASLLLLRETMHHLDFATINVF